MGKAYRVKSPQEGGLWWWTEDVGITGEGKGECKIHEVENARLFLEGVGKLIRVAPLGRQKDHLKEKLIVAESVQGELTTIPFSCVMLMVA